MSQQSAQQVSRLQVDSRPSTYRSGPSTKSHQLYPGLSLNADSRWLYIAYPKKGHTAQKQYLADCENPSWSMKTEIDGRKKSRVWPHLDNPRSALYLPSGMTDLPKDFAIDIDLEGLCSMTSEVNGETVVSNLGSIFYPTEKNKEDGQGSEGHERTETGTKTEGGVV